MVRIDYDIINELLHIDGELERLILKIKDRRKNSIYKREMKRIHDNTGIAYRVIRKAIETCE